MQSAIRRMLVAALDLYRQGVRTQKTVSSEELTVQRIISVRIALENGVDRVTDVEEVFDGCDQEAMLAIVQMAGDTRAAC